MIHLQLICQYSDALYPQGLSCLLDSIGCYQVSICDYQEVGALCLCDTLLPVILWESEKEPYILDCMTTLQKFCNKIFIIARNSFHKTQLRGFARELKIGIVTSEITIAALHQYIQELIHSEQRWIFSPGVVSGLIEELLLTDIAKESYGLSKSEHQIIELAKQGYSLKKTAEVMSLSRNTVAAYRSKILHKTGMKSMSELIASCNHNTS